MGRCNRHAKHCTQCKSLSFVESPGHQNTRSKRRSPLLQTNPALKKVPSVSFPLPTNNWVENGFQNVVDTMAHSPKKKNKSKRDANVRNSALKSSKKITRINKYSPLEFISSSPTPPPSSSTERESSEKINIEMSPNRNAADFHHRHVLTSTGSETASLPENILEMSSINSLEFNFLGQFLQETPCRSWASTGEILVEDTPPRFYGFTLKQRQKLEMKKPQLLS